ncbi:MAG: proprotein convertase P-domain-containing protein, partial [Dehalococcoidia bacterium]|nr:proprotein convertase P-domain-containing protein [Dehalococcoidia bacterium]
MLEIKAREVRAKYPVYSGEDENLNGTWTLQVSDVIAGYEGQLNSWGIRLTDTITDYGALSPIAVGNVAN